jgi:hypothetical protein
MERIVDGLIILPIAILALMYLTHEDEVEKQEHEVICEELAKSDKKLTKEQVILCFEKKGL